MTHISYIRYQFIICPIHTSLSTTKRIPHTRFRYQVSISKPVREQKPHCYFSNPVLMTKPVRGQNLIGDSPIRFQLQNHRRGLRQRFQVGIVKRVLKSSGTGTERWEKWWESGIFVHPPQEILCFAPPPVETQSFASINSLIRSDA